MGIAILILIVVAAIGRALTKDQSKRRKHIVWDILVLIGLNLFVSWLIGIGFAIIVEEGFAGIGIMVILFVALFIIGAIILVSGLFTKIDIEQASPK